MKKIFNLFHANKGYSFIEMIISLSIIGIVSAISVSSLINFYERKADEKILFQLVHSLKFAHDEAITQALSIGVCQSNNQQNCRGNWKDGYIVFVDTFQDGSVRNKKQLLAVRNNKAFNGTLYYRAYPSYRHYLLFSAKGWMNNDNGTFWYCPQKKSFPAWAIFINKSGKTRIQYADQNNQIKDGHGKFLSCQPTNTHQVGPAQ